MCYSLVLSYIVQLPIVPSIEQDHVGIVIEKPIENAGNLSVRKRGGSDQWWSVIRIGRSIEDVGTWDEWRRRFVVEKWWSSASARRVGEKGVWKWACLEAQNSWNLFGKVHKPRDHSYISTLGYSTSWNNTNEEVSSESSERDITAAWQVARAKSEDMTWRILLDTNRVALDERKRYNQCTHTVL